MKNKTISDKQDVDILLVNVLYEILQFLKTFPDPTPTQNDYLDSADVKQLLNISDSTLNRIRKHKRIPFIKLGNKIFYPKSFFTEAMKKDHNQL